MPPADGDTRLHDGRLQTYEDPPGRWVDVSRVHDRDFAPDDPLGDDE